MYVWLLVSLGGSRRASRHVLSGAATPFWIVGHESVTPQHPRGLHYCSDVFETKITCEQDSEKADQKVVRVPSMVWLVPVNDMAVLFVGSAIVKYQIRQLTCSGKHESFCPATRF